MLRPKKERGGLFSKYQGLPLAIKAQVEIRERKVKDAGRWDVLRWCLAGYSQKPLEGDGFSYKNTLTGNCTSEEHQQPPPPQTKLCIHRQRNGWLHKGLSALLLHTPQIQPPGSLLTAPQKESGHHWLGAAAFSNQTAIPPRLQGEQAPIIGLQLPSLPGSNGRALVEVDPGCTLGPLLKYTNKTAVQKPHFAAAAADTSTGLLSWNTRCKSNVIHTPWFWRNPCRAHAGSVS